VGDKVAIYASPAVPPAAVSFVFWAT
jgi:hypothetical protein